MRLYPRITVPILGALVVAGSSLGWTWWQLRADTLTTDSRINQATQSASGSVVSNAGTPEDIPLDPGDTVLIHLRQGDLFALQGEWASAETEYQSAVSAGGGVAALHKLAQAQLQRREIDKVKLTMQELRRLGARSEDILLLQVIVALRTGELDQAKSLLADADDSPQLHYALGLIAVIEGKHDEAKKQLQETVSGWDPTLRAYARVLLNAYDEFALFDQSKPIHLTTLLSRALAQAQECELALPLLSQVLTEDQDYRDAWTVQGYCELTTERTADALSSFEHAYAIDPEKPEIQYFLGRTYIVLEQWSNAATFLEYALVNGFEPQREVRSRLAFAATKAGDADKALEQLRALITDPEADFDTFKQAIALSMETQRVEDAYQIARSGIERWPTNAEALALVGAASMASGRLEEARGYFEQALTIDPRNAKAKEGLKLLQETTK